MSNIPTPDPIQDITHIERQKIIILVVIGLLVIIVFAFVLNTSTIFNRLYSDFFLRWYATAKLFSEGRNLYDRKNYIFVFLFVFSWLSFFFNFLFPKGSLLTSVETIYRRLFPRAVTVFSIPLLWQKISYD